MMVLDMAARLQAPLAVRFACLVHDLGKGTTPQDMLPRHIGHELRSSRLLQAVAERLSRFARPVRLRIDPAQAGALRARLFASGAVREETTADDGTLELVATLPEAQQLELARTAGVEVSELPQPQTCAPDGGYLQSAALRAS